MKITKIATLTGHNSAIYSLIAAEESPSFFSGAGDGWLVRWDLRQPDMGRLVAKVETQIFSLLHLPDIQTVVAGNMNGGLHWIDLQQPDKTKNIAHHSKSIFDIQGLQDVLLTVGGDGLCTKWSIAEKRTIESLQLSPRALRCMAFAPRRNEIAIGSSDHNIYILDAADLTLKKTIEKAHDNSVFTLAYTPDESHLLSGGRDAHLKVWKMAQNYQLVKAQPGHWFTINHIAFHPKGQYFATASRDKTIKIWDTATFQLLKVLDVPRDGCHANSVNKLHWSAYNHCLLSCSDDRSIMVWQVTGEKRI